MAQRKKTPWSKGSLKKQRSRDGSNRIRQQGDRLYLIPMPLRAVLQGGDCSPHVSAALHTAVLSSATGIGAGRNRGPAAKNWSTATRTCTQKQCLHKCSATEQQYAGAPFVAETTCGQNVHSGLARPKSTLSSLDAPKHSCADLLILLHRSVIIKTRRRCGLNIRSWTKSGTETITSVRRCVNTDADTVADRFCVSNL